MKTTIGAAPMTSVLRRTYLLLVVPVSMLVSAAPSHASRQSHPVAVAGGEPVDAPIVLSDPDGQDLVLEELTVKAAIHGMLSLTELELRFRNPQARQIEGRFSCVLPAGAAISRFAKEVDGRLMAASFRSPRAEASGSSSRTASC
jgi:hypothetical protein